jgi:hypothetical protein
MRAMVLPRMVSLVEESAPLELLDLPVPQPRPASFQASSNGAKRSRDKQSRIA